MKHKLLIIAIQFVVFSSVYAQNVNGLLFDATNTATRDASAAFEINANTNTPGSPLYGGLLLPRVALTGTTDAATISGAEAASLLVYNTATVSDVTPGFYYWNGSSWLRIISGNGSFPTGSGTPNYLARWITSSTLGIGASYDDGTNLGVGTTAPGWKLDVNGNARIGANAGQNALGALAVSAGQGSATTYRDIDLHGSWAGGEGHAITASHATGAGNIVGQIVFEHNSPGSRIKFGRLYHSGDQATYPMELVSNGSNAILRMNTDAYTYYGPNSTWGAYLQVGGNGRVTTSASVAATNGNLHLDAADGGFATYINYYSANPTYINVNAGNVGIGNAAPGYKLDVTGNTRTTGKFFGHLNVDDTRSVNTVPTGYNNEVAFDFKERSVLNSAPGSGTFGGLMTMAPWGDNSGDASHQLLFNEGGIYWRQGQPDAATWDSWTQVLTTAPGGGGTPNYLARWITANQLGIGVAYDDGTNVGIGITSPQKRLDVLSNVNDFVTVGANTFGVGQWTGIHFGYRENNSSYRKSAIVFERTDNSGGGGNAAGKIHILNGPAAGAGSATLADSRLTIGENGNVGIGETAPAAKLEIEGISANWNESTPGLGLGSVHLDPGSGSDHFGSAITWGASDASNGDNAQAGIYVRSDGSYGTKFYFATTDNYGLGSRTRMYIGADGNVGVNNTVPAFKLDVQQDITMSGDINPGTSQFSVGGTSTVGKRMLLGYDTNGNGFGFIKAGNYGVAWTPLSLQPNGGNVGVGTTSPAKKFDVQGAAAVGSNYITGALLDVGNTTVDYPGNSGWTGSWNSNILLSGLDNTSITFHDAGVSVGALNYKANQFSFDGAGSWGPASVGINTRTPQGKLDVTGDIFGVNEYSFQGCAESIKDWEYSGLNTNPTCNGAGDDSWYIDVPGTSNWGRGILSRRRFSRTPGLTLEYEAYLNDAFGYGYVHWMVGFVDGNSTTYNYCQNPSNLMYHDNIYLSAYENCTGQGSDYSVDTRNGWYKFKIVLKGAGADYYIFHSGAWRLVKSTTTNSNKYVRVHVTGHNSRIYFRNMKIYQGDLNATASGPFTASYSTGSTSSNQSVYFSSGGDVVSNTSPTVFMSGPGSILLVANLTATATSVTYNSAPNYSGGANIAGTASFRVELQRSINGGGWVTVMSGSDNVGLQTADMYRVMGAYYGWIAAGPNSSGVYGDRFSFPGNVSINYIENATIAGTYAYRLVFVPLGYNRNGGYYEIWDRSLNAVPIRQ